MVSATLSLLRIVAAYTAECPCTSQKSEKPSRIAWLGSALAATIFLIMIVLCSIAAM